MLSIDWVLIYLLLGCFVGFMAGLLGIGGGGILVPLLISIFTYQKIPPEHSMHLALGTALACMIITSIASLRAHAARGNVVWHLALSLAPGIMLGAFFMAQSAAAINPVYIAVFFCAFMMLIAGQMLFNWQPKINPSPLKSSHLLLVGSGIGAMSALATVGGGFLTLSYLSYKNIDIKKAIGTSAAIGLAIAIAGTLGYVVSGWDATGQYPNSVGFIQVPVFLAISLSSILAAPQGARLATRLPGHYLKRIFAVVSFLLSVKMLYSVIFV